MSRPFTVAYFEAVISVASISAFKNAIALLFGIAIAIAFACNMLCLFKRKPGSTHGHNTVIQQPVVDDGHYKEHSALQEVAKGSCHHEPDTENQDDCCQNLTKYFYQSLTKISEPGSYLYYGGVADCIPGAGRIPQGLVIGKQANSYFSYCRPPTHSGHHLRILMGSFII